MNKKNFLKYFALFLTLIALPFTAAAQVMDTISYVPVKQGYYNKISTKSKAQFATQTSAASIKSLQANSSALEIVATQVSFGKPVSVKGNVFVRPTSKDQAALKATAVEVQGEAYAGGVVVGTKAPLLTTVVARDLNLINRVVRLPSSSSIIIDGITIPSPSGCSEGVEWRAVKAKNTGDILKDYTVLACKGTGGGSTNTCSVPQIDITRCTSNNFVWNDSECCCQGTSQLLFLEATMCEDVTLICNADRTITSAAAVCNQFAADSAECICARGNLKQCTPKVYGGGSDEARCVQSGEYHEACQCSYFLDFQSNFENYACTGIPAKCAAGDNGGGSTYSCSPSTRPISSQVCRSCGMQTRTVTCNTSTGAWDVGAWSFCDTTGCSALPCNFETGSLCSNCGGTWDETRCLCNCGSYGGNTCTFDAYGCKCGNLYKACK